MCGMDGGGSSQKEYVGKAKIVKGVATKIVKLLKYSKVLLFWVGPEQDVSLEGKNKQTHSIVATGLYKARIM